MNLILSSLSAGLDGVAIERGENERREVVIREDTPGRWAASSLARALDVVAAATGTTAEELLRRDRLERGDLAGPD